jgi:hypothetical protein
MTTRRRGIFLNLRPVSALPLAILVALVFTAVCAGSAVASPAWRLGGTQLVGPETIVGKALENSFTIPGLTTKCELSYKMSIANSAGVGKGEITEFLLKGCSTSTKACTVKTAVAEKLPWPLHLATVATNIYVILEKVRIGFLYSGEECALDEIPVTVTGSAGGLFNNASSTIALNPSNFIATGTELRALGTRIDWNSVLTTEATGAHTGQALEVG